MNDVDAQDGPPVWLARLAEATSRATDTTELVDALLRLLQELTGLESTYLTRIDWDGQVQEIIQSLNTGALTISEGLLVPWSDTLCRRAMEEEVPWADDVPARWGDSDAARELGIHTYVSVPVAVAVDGPPWGTLCGVASDPRPGDPLVLATMGLFSRLVGHALREDQRAAEAEARAVAQTAFIVTAEHAMKTPAATVLVWAETLLARREELSTEELTDGLERIRGNAKRLLALLQDMITQARTELSSRELTLGPVDLAELAGRVASELTTPEHPVEVRGVGVVATTDESALTVILDHLVDNSRSYTPTGCVTTITVSRDGERAILEVRDDGPGLPAGVDIFEPFVRGTAEGHGSGLGLAIVHRLVEAIGGAITARSDGGAVFTVQLPLAA